MADERRQYPRLAMQLPLEFYPADGDRGHMLRTTTTNISPGGLMFEADVLNGAPVPAEHSFINVELTVPPGDGHSPYEGSVRSVAEVLRCQRIESDVAPTGLPHRRLRIAARFHEPLKLAF